MAAATRQPLRFTLPSRGDCIGCLVLLIVQPPAACNMDFPLRRRFVSTLPSPISLPQMATRPSAPRSNPVSAAAHVLPLPDADNVRDEIAAVSTRRLRHDRGQLAMRQCRCGCRCRRRPLRRHCPQVRPRIRPFARSGATAAWPCTASVRSFSNIVVEFQILRRRAGARYGSHTPRIWDACHPLSTPGYAWRPSVPLCPPAYAENPLEKRECSLVARRNARALHD